MGLSGRIEELAVDGQSVRFRVEPKGVEGWRAVGVASTPKGDATFKVDTPSTETVEIGEEIYEARLILRCGADEVDERRAHRTALAAPHVDVAAADPEGQVVSAGSMASVRGTGGLGAINESARVALGALYKQYTKEGTRRFRVTAESSILSDAGLSEEDARRGLTRLAEKRLVVEGDRGVFSLEAAGVDAQEHPERLDDLLPLRKEIAPGAPSGAASATAAPQAAAPVGDPDPLARLKLARSAIDAHRQGSCPKGHEHSLTFADQLDKERDTVSRRWSCSKCDYTSVAAGVPISDWGTNNQRAWYLKAAEQRAKEELIRCPTCGQESIEAEEAGVKAIGTSSHVWLSCKTRGCDFAKRKVRRSLLWTAVAGLQYAALLGLVALVVWFARKALNPATPSAGDSPQVTPTAMPAPSSTPSGLPAQEGVKIRAEAQIDERRSPPVLRVRARFRNDYHVAVETAVLTLRVWKKWSGSGNSTDPRDLFYSESRISKCPDGGCPKDSPTRRLVQDQGAALLLPPGGDDLEEWNGIRIPKEIARDQIAFQITVQLATAPLDNARCDVTGFGQPGANPLMSPSRSGVTCDFESCALRLHDPGTCLPLPAGSP